MNLLARSLTLAGGLISAGLMAVGCTTSAEDRVVGVYSLDPVRSKIPEFPGSAGLQSQVRSLARNTKLKVRSDHSFVLTGVRVTEGTWTLEGDTLRLRAKDLDAVKLLGNEDGELVGTVRDGQALIIEKDTLIGRIRVHLRKTG